eukprot:287372-Hanusia_phi.AAC.1
MRPWIQVQQHRRGIGGGDQGIAMWGRELGEQGTEQEDQESWREAMQHERKVMIDNNGNNAQDSPLPHSHLALPVLPRHVPAISAPW